MTNAKWWLSFLFAGVAAAAPPAAPPDVAALLEELGKRYSTLDAYYFDAVRKDEVVKDGALGAAESNLTLAVKKPAKLHFRYRNAAVETLLVTNGETTWRALPSEKRWAQETLALLDDEDDEDKNDEGKSKDQPGDPAATAASSLVGRYAVFGKLAARAKWIKSQTLKVGDAKADCEVVEIDLGKSKHTVWIDRERYLVVQHEEKVTNADGYLKMQLRLRKFALRDQVEDSLFAFNAPEKWKKEESIVFPNEQGRSLEGRAAPAFRLSTVEGENVDLAELRGKVVLINFWATWCPPCRAELPDISKLHQKYAGSDTVILTVNNEGGAIAKNYVKDKKLSLAVLNDTKRQVSKLYGIRAIPTVLVVDKKGVVRHHWTGQRPVDVLTKAIERLRNGG
jgi:peroxiredoxin/outer membrane lipoprotein-sorting protein